MKAWILEKINKIFFVSVDDHTRVCLSNLGDNGSDYINANYIDVSVNNMISLRPKTSTDTSSIKFLSRK